MRMKTINLGNKGWVYHNGKQVSYGTPCSIEMTEAEMLDGQASLLRMQEQISVTLDNMKRLHKKMKQK